MKAEELAQIVKSLNTPEALERFARSLSAAAPQRRESVDLVRRTFGTEIKADTINEDARSVHVIASTAAIDSYDEIVDQNWRLERYTVNPVVLYGHNQVGFLGMGGDPSWTLPVGFATQVTARDRLEATLNFVDANANPFAVKVWEQFRQRSMRAVSVGFYPHDVYREVRDDVEIYHLNDNELFEISAVPLPANPECVGLNAERSAQREWFRARALKSKTISVPSPAVRTASEKKMKTIEELQAELETAQTALRTANEALNAKSTEVGGLTAQLQAKGTTLETAQKRIETLEAELTASKATVTELQTKAAEKDEQLTKVSGEFKALEATSQAAEVDALIGKKFAPAERATMIKLRATSPDLFAETVANRPDMAHAKDITGSDPTATTNHAKSAITGSKLAQRARDEADKAAAKAS